MTAYSAGPALETTNPGEDTKFGAMKLCKVQQNTTGLPQTAQQANGERTRNGECNGVVKLSKSRKVTSNREEYWLDRITRESDNIRVRQQFLKQSIDRIRTKICQETKTEGDIRLADWSKLVERMPYCLPDLFIEKMLIFQLNQENTKLNTLLKSRNDLLRQMKTVAKSGVRERVRPLLPQVVSVLSENKFRHSARRYAISAQDEMSQRRSERAYLENQSENSHQSCVCCGVNNEKPSMKNNCSDYQRLQDETFGYLKLQKVCREMNPKQENEKTLYNFSRLRKTTQRKILRDKFLAKKSSKLNKNRAPIQRLKTELSKSNKKPRTESKDKTNVINKFLPVTDLNQKLAGNIQLQVSVNRKDTESSLSTSVGEEQINDYIWQYSDSSVRTSKRNLSPKFVSTLDVLNQVEKMAQENNLTVDYCEDSDSSSTGKIQSAGVENLNQASSAIVTGAEKKTEEEVILKAVDENRPKAESAQRRVVVRGLPYVMKEVRVLVKDYRFINKNNVTAVEKENSCRLTKEKSARDYNLETTPTSVQQASHQQLPQLPTNTTGSPMESQCERPDKTNAVQSKKTVADDCHCSRFGTNKDLLHRKRKRYSVGGPCFVFGRQSRRRVAPPLWAPALSSDLLVSQQGVGSTDLSKTRLSGNSEDTSGREGMLGALASLRQMIVARSTISDAQAKTIVATITALSRQLGAQDNPSQTSVLHPRLTSDSAVNTTDLCNF